MAHDLFKLGLTLVVLAIVIVITALLVSGYLSAFKPGGKSHVPSITAGASGGRGGHAAIASPTPRPGAPRNVPVAGGGYPPYAQYPPSGPMAPAIPPPQAMQPQAGQAEAPPVGSMQPEGVPPGSAQQPAPSSGTAPTPTSSVEPTPQPSGEGPANSPYMTVWETIIDQLIRMFSRIFTGQGNTYPAWPQSGFAHF